MAASEVGRALAAIKESSGMTWAELARHVGASSGDYVRKVASGAKPGRNLATAAHQLATRGQVSTPPERRRSASGDLARVRSSVARTGAKSAHPVLAAPEPQPRRGRFGTQTTLTRAGRGRTVQVSMPKTPGVGRAAGDDAVQAELARAGKAQVTMRVLIQFPDGARWVTRLAHGQSARSILAAARRNVFGSVLAVIGEMFANGSAGADGRRIIGVELSW